jgi:hypothetical protein
MGIDLPGGVRRGGEGCEACQSAGVLGNENGMTLFVSTRQRLLDPLMNRSKDGSGIPPGRHANDQSRRQL